MSPDQIAIIINLLVAVIFPVLVGLVTQTTTNSAIKAVLLASISFASSIGAQLLASGWEGFDWFTALIGGLGAWVIAVATHFGFWRPTGVTAAVQAVGSKHVA